MQATRAPAGKGADRSQDTAGASEGLERRAAGNARIGECVRQPSRNINLLRESNRVLNSVEAQALPHAAFRWLYGILMVWNGHNNAAIQFTRRRHGANYGLASAKTFEAARKIVLQSGLVKVTREGNRGRPHCYGITVIKYEAQPDGKLGHPWGPSEAEKLGHPCDQPETKCGHP